MYQHFTKIKRKEKRSNTLEGDKIIENLTVKPYHDCM